MFNVETLSLETLREINSSIAKGNQAKKLLAKLGLAIHNTSEPEDLKGEEYEKAIESFEKAYALNKESADTVLSLTAAYNTLGKKHLNAKESEKAIESFEKAYALGPSKGSSDTVLGLTAAYNTLGKKHLNAKEYEKAIEFLEKAYALPKNPNTEQVINNLAGAYSVLGCQQRKSGAYEAAIATYKKALAITKNNNIQVIYANLANTYNELGIHQLDLEEYEKAIDIFKEALALPDNVNTHAVNANLPIAYNKLGIHQLNLREYEEAIATYKKALAITKNNNDILVIHANLAKAYNLLGIQQLDLREYEKAIDTFKKSLDIAKDDNTADIIQNLADAYVRLGEQLCSNGKFMEAAALFERVYIDESKISAPDDLIQQIIALHTNIAKEQKDAVIHIIDKALYRALDASSPHSSTYKQIIVNYHSVCGKELAEALVSSCAKGKYSKIQKHITILKEFLSTTPEVLKHLTYLHLSLAKHSGDLDYLSHIDDSFLSAEYLQEINILKAEVYFKQANKFRNEGDFEKAIEFLEKCKKLESEKEGLAELGKSIYLGVSKILKESDPEKALDYFKKAKEIDKNLMSETANKDLACDILINLAKVSMQHDTEASIKKAIKFLSEAEKYRKSPDISKSKIEAYLKLAYGEEQSKYLAQAFTELTNLKNGDDHEAFDMYATQICVRYLRTGEEGGLVIEDAKTAVKKVVELLQSENIKDSELTEALVELLKGADVRHHVVCGKINSI